MFVRKKKNKSGTTSIQIVDKSSGSYRIVKSLGSSVDPQTIDFLFCKAHHMLPELVGQLSLRFSTQADHNMSQLMKLNKDTFKIRVIGPEVIFGKLFDAIGFNAIKEELFRHLVITRLVYPGSKLKTIDYLERYQGITIPKDNIYRFLDKLHSKYKTIIEDLSFEHTKKILKGNIGIVFYDMTTLYFESEDEDDLRKTGFSKDGKHQNPQIYLGLLVGKNGYPIGYEIFEGNISEGKTLLPVLMAFEERFKLNKPVIVADAGLLSNKNISLLISNGYQYILGARIKNESMVIKEKILALNLSNNDCADIKKHSGERLIISYTNNRASKDKHNRLKGLKRLEQNFKAGKLTKHHINNRGYNKYLRLIGKVKLEINYDKFETDGRWDGLKGYVTNTDLPPPIVIENYQNLWHIEKAFRISKTDLRIRPIYHHLRERIESHICIAFAAYTIYKEVERLLNSSKCGISAKRATELAQTIYSLEYQLPDSQEKEQITIGLSDEQKMLCNILKSNP